jgi:hypothetical protein
VLVDYFSRPGCHLYFVSEEDVLDVEFYLRELGVPYNSGMERDYEICCAVGLLKREEVRIEYKVRGKSCASDVVYFRLTGIGIEFLESCARDTIRMLEQRQQEMDAEYKSSKPYKDGARANRMVFRSKNSKRIIN